MSGIGVSAAEVQNTCGTAAKTFFTTLDQVKKIQAWLASKQDSELTALGISSADVADLKSAYNDLAQLAAIFEGTQALATAKDFRVFARRLVGMTY